MLKMKYAGPKVEISQHGIHYDKAQEDTYVYLMVALEILQDIDNDYSQKECYTHDYKKENFQEEKLHHILKSYEKEIENHAEKEYQDFEEKIAHEITHVQNIPHLTAIEKEVWIKNIELMKSYRLQRTINKIYYEHCIENTRKLLIHKKIKSLTTPFDKNFFHVLHSLKDTLIMGHPSFDATIQEEINQVGDLTITLNIKN